MAITTSDMISTLKERLMDPNGDQFADAQLYRELILAQHEFINRVDQRLLAKIIQKDELVQMDLNGEYDLSDLTDIYDYAQPIISVQTYEDENVVDSVFLSEEEINKFIKNDLFAPSGSRTYYRVMNGKLIVYGGSNSTSFGFSGLSEGNTILAPAAGSSGSMSATDDYYNKMKIKSPNGNYYTVTDYDGSTKRLTISPGLLAADADLSDPVTFTFYSYNKYPYTGYALVSYIKLPTEFSASGESELSDRHKEIILLIAESNIWRSDGKIDNAMAVSQNAINQINMLNGTIKPTDNIGYRAVKH